MPKQLFRDPAYGPMVAVLTEREREQLEGAAARIQDRVQVGHETMLCAMIPEARTELLTALHELSALLQLLHVIETRTQLTAADVS